MISLKIVQKSVIISLIIQVTTTIIQLFGLFFKVSKKDEILRSVLKIETIVQIVEGIFYIWLAYSFYKLKDVTSRRYYDWMLTTPTMLLATIIYFKYLEKREFTFFEFLENNKTKYELLVFLDNIRMEIKNETLPFPFFSFPCISAPCCA